MVPQLRENKNQAVSLFPSRNSFCKNVSAAAISLWSVALMHTNALAVPWSACLWFLRNLGSVPLSDGYLEVLGFLILRAIRQYRRRMQSTRPSTEMLVTRSGAPCATGCAETSSWTLEGNQYFEVE